MIGSNLFDKWALNRVNRLNSAFNVNQYGRPFSLDYQGDKPSWISLSTPQDFEKAVRFNPVVKSAINLLATSSSNGKKIATDISSGETIPWTEKRSGIQEAYKLLIQRPNPVQSAKEFAFQGTFYLKTFGNRYVNVVLPLGMDKEIDLMNIGAMYNLPSQFIEVRKTGKLYSQTELKGIISKYARTNVNPVEEYEPEWILHFNEVNISSDQPTLMGVSKLEVLKMPITNTQLAFEAMNTILKSRGMQGIISPKKTDGMGTSVSLTPNEKKEVDDKFKNDYGLLNGQNPFLLTPVALDYIKTVMNSKELGIYEEFSNNAILIGNEFGVPPELIKTYIQGATYENQVQSVRRLYENTTIPMVDEEDSYWSYRLNTAKYGFEIKTTWDHIPALQDGFKDKAIALRYNGMTSKEAYTENTITVNEYRLSIEEDILPDGDVYKFEWDKKNTPNENNENNETEESEVDE